MNPKGFMSTMSMMSAIFYSILLLIFKNKKLEWSEKWLTWLTSLTWELDNILAGNRGQGGAGAA